MTDLPAGPIRTRDALELGVSPKVLRGPRYRRLYRGVLVRADVALTSSAQIRAASLALPHDARLSHASRCHVLGLEFPLSQGVHFTIARDLHLSRVPRDIVLHRTKVMPPLDAVGVTPAAALVQLAAELRPIDLLKVGDWLVANQHAGLREIAELSDEQTWRPGARKIQRWHSLLRDGSASIAETECRVLLAVAGLPEPRLNAPVLDSPNSPIGDLWLPEFGLCIEHEGNHHFTDAAQIRRDTWRYAQMRAAGIEYIQAHRRMLDSPRAFVLLVHRTLVERGYRGPPPVFGDRWRSLFVAPHGGFAPK